ncbi:MAG: DUF4276 family protein [Magnetococcus sp. DMHC-6]
MAQLVFLLEELSAKALLQGLLPRLLPQETQVQYIVFEGKHYLEKQLPKKLHGWQNRESKFIVLRDKDAADCRMVKTRLQKLCQRIPAEKILIRIACRELESWYLGDLTAVESAFNVRGIAKLQNKEKFHTPDLLNSFEELKSLVPNYQKISGSRAMGQAMDLQNNSSQSYQAFIKGIHKLITSI